MARTHPYHDWDQPAGPDQRRRPEPAQWDGLRNELIALLDQVEDQILTQPEPKAPAPAPQQPRRDAALRSVQHAVDRLAEKTEPVASAARRDSVAEAIGQIRARQTGGGDQDRTAQSAELAGLARSVAQLGARIEQFETAIGTRLDTLSGQGDIAAQVAQLSEVIELLANAVGESGQVKRLEAQIGQLSEAVIRSGRESGEAAAARIGELAAVVEKLAAHQMEGQGRGEQMALAADQRQTDSLRLIEDSVRNIYDRLDALETARPAALPELERLSQDMAVLSAAVRDGSDPDGLLARIDALAERIGQMETPSDGAAASLAQSVSALRGVVAEAIEPRFSALEARIEDLGKADATTARPDLKGVETQLRQLSKRVEETGRQLSELAALRSQDPAAPEPVDVDALAEAIASRYQPMEADTGASEGIDKADLAALEDRLTALFGAEAASQSAAQSHFEDVRAGIAQVDERLNRLEAMLNRGTGAPVPAVAPEAVPEHAPRRPRADAMPADPASGAPSRDEPAGAGTPPAPESQTPAFRIDPMAIERPAKPQSSFARGEDNPFQAERMAPGASAAPRGAEGSSLNRSSFIEAARRSARQPDVPAPPQSLIGRALSRFQRAEADDGEDRVGETLKRIDPETAPDPLVMEAAEHAVESEPAPGFFARNRRALLLGAALIVVLALTAQLVLNRPSGGPAPALPAVTEPAPADADAVQPAPLETAPETGDGGGLTSGVRMIDQDTALSVGAPDMAALIGDLDVDPVETAALALEPDRHISRGATAPAGISAALPAIAVPEAIEPEALRRAAEAGDMHAQFEVGAILTEGHAVTQDLVQAAAWYERAAAQGFAPAQYRLGNLYEGGRGVERDLEMARLWYQRAAEAGNRMSMHNLASLYAGGELESQDFAAAAHWFEEAAARGLTDSQFNLGMLYARGLGLEQSFADSYVWFSLAARAGDEDAANAREDVARSLDTETVQRLNETIAAWEPADIDMTANFAPIGTWDNQFDPGQAIASREVILRVQMLLDKLGFDVGQPDGIAGPRTREAIASFERATGMSESGEVNPRLLAVLGSQPV